MSQYWEHEIKTLSEWLGLLKITEDTSERTTKYTNNISIVLAPAIVQSKQAILPKNIVPDLG